MMKVAADAAEEPTAPATEQNSSSPRRAHL